MMDNRATCSVLLYAIDPDALSLFLAAISSISNTVKEDDGCLGGSCVSKVIWELVLLPTVEVEVLPDGKSPTLLGVLLPEVEEAGIVEKRFVGGDIDGNTEGKIMTKKTLDRMKFLSKQKKERKARF
jgi:DNA-binding transcriptional ArsR family regulator